MRRSIPGRERPARAALAVALVLLAGALLGLGIHWYRILLAPKETRAPAPLLATSAVVAADRIVEANLFGSPAASTPREPATVSALNIKLKGVFAGGEGPGYAIVNTGGTDEPFSVGREVLPGVVLAAVHPSHIDLSRAGTLERVYLERIGPPASAVQAQAVASPGAIQRRSIVPGISAAHSIPAAPAVAVKAPRPEDGAGNFVANPGGGLSILNVNAGSMTESLGLEAGDVVLSVNGRPLSTQSELEAFYARLKPGQPVAIEALRGGRRVQLSERALIH